MNYLSCTSQSSISTADSHAKSSSQPKNKRDDTKPIKITEFDYTDLELATSNFSDSKLLGRGSHGLVYKGVLRGGRLVAVKKPSQKTPVSQTPNEFENEIDILSKLQSPKIVNLVGFTKKESRDRLLVVEFMSRGTLFDVLHSNPRPLSWGRRVKLALQTARAIETLHSSNPPVIHRDIKSANVLIDSNFNARLGDFGLALRIGDDYRFKSTPPAGTMGYLDPCYVTPDNLSTKTDVFSFGILLLEIISGRKALDMGNSPPSVVDWAIPLIKKGKLSSVYDLRVFPPRNDTVRKMLGVLAAKCVRPCKERRPSMRQVVECLAELSRLLPLHSWSGLANPCMMVENVGRPVQTRKVENENLDNDGGENNGGLLRNGGRVYSDLGFRRNLRELLDGHDDGSDKRGEDGKRVSSLRFEIGRLADVRSVVFGDGKSIKSRESVGVGLDKFSKLVDKINTGSNVELDMAT
ncbi:Serine/threonine-protein kinase-like protein [Striga hermonthica]|uniref:Serine/threonine-protein kinase-like protein n=1 Tax=Striga hermonthica TaxID=68872 RepID=A0A9N7MFP8_STRHE|nr:Serine/threonine-protein kinase-like protein [Striga hermonthica]